MESQPANLYGSLIGFKGTFFGTPDLGQERQFLAASERYMKKLADTTIILERYIASDQAYKDWIKFIFDPAKLTRDGMIKLEKGEILEARRLQKLAASVSLDYEDFFIHSKILMDRLAYLTKFLLKPTPAHKTFAAHRKFFLENDYPSDPEYAAYIKNNTGWYETMLRQPRNDNIVHDTLSEAFGPSSHPNELTRPIRVRFPDDSNPDDTGLVDFLLRMQEKYAPSVPGLRGLVPNIYEILEFFDVNVVALNNEEAELLERARKRFGRKLPDLAKLAMHVIEFLNFFGNHFDTWSWE